MTIINNLIIISSLGKTDCRRSKIYHENNKIFTQRIRGPGESRTSHCVTLPILMAVLASQEAIDEAIVRIFHVQQQMKIFVDITDLEK